MYASKGPSTTADHRDSAGGGLELGRLGEPGDVARHHQVEGLLVDHRRRGRHGLRVLAAEVDVGEVGDTLGCTSSDVLRQVGSGFSGEMASSGVDI